MKNSNKQERNLTIILDDLNLDQPILDEDKKLFIETWSKDVNLPKTDRWKYCVNFSQQGI